MTDTPKLGLTYLEASQAQKHVTVNDALRQLDGLVQASAADKDLTAPPGSPSTGDAYIVAAGATGVWAGHDGKLAVYHDTAWYFYTPAAGWLVYVEDEAEHYAFNGAAWVTYASLIGANFVAKTGDTMSGDLTLEAASATLAVGRGNNVGPHAVDFYKDDDTKGVSVVYRTTPDTLGVEDGAGQSMVEFPTDRADGVDSFADWDFNSKYLLGISRIGLGGATPDATNTFAFYGTNLLLNSGGSIDMTYNKNASGNDASFSFKTGFSSKALLGLLGNDDFTLKVGASFTTALVADETTGFVSLPQGFATDSSLIGGHAMVICGERNGNISAGSLMAMGNGASNTAGAVMPKSGKVVAAGVSAQAGTAGNNIISVAVNKVENTSYQVSLNYSGSGVETGYSDFSGAPLAFSAGDALNMIVNTASPVTGVVTSLYVVFD